MARFGPMQTRNFLLSKYNITKSGIYCHNDNFNMHVMRPNFSTKAFYNGYFWQHRTNDLGLRMDQNLNEADIVTLGDSYVYGHGVDVEHTFPTILGELSGLKIANLGIQADYPVFEYIRFKHMGLFLKPKLVLFFVNGWQDENDFIDFNPEKQFIDRIINEAPSRQYCKNITESPYWNKECEVNWGAKKFLIRDLILRTIRFSSNAIKTWQHSGRKKIDPLTVKNIMRLITSDMKNLCDKYNSKLVMVLQAGTDKNSYLNNAVKTLCREQDIVCLELGQHGVQEEYFLPNDGHYSKKGHLWVANVLWSELLKLKIL